MQIELGVKIPFIILLLIHPILLINFIQGQPCLLQLFFILVSLSFFRSKKYLLAGLFISFILIKPQIFAILVFMSILVKNRHFILGSMLGALTMFLINIFLYGKNFVGDYITLLQKTNTPYYGSHIGASYTIQSILERVDRIIGLKISWDTLPISFLLIAAIGIVLFFIRDRLQGNFGENLGLSILLAIPLGAHLLNHDLIILAIPVGIYFYPFNSTYKLIYIGIVYILTWTYFLLNISVLYNTSLIGLGILSIFSCFYIKNVIWRPKHKNVLDENMGEHLKLIS